jgi:short subunit dehydrogenase-like uncharacterized protein
MKRDLDLVVYGATGFTGRLVAEVLQSTYGSKGGLAWALAGRDPDRLARVRADVGADASLPLVAADATDAHALAAMACRTRALISTVGPYQRHGEPLVRACAAAGTDYLDLCGEPPWMARMIRELQAPAAASGARIVFSCGFDSIPFDLGVVFLQAEAQRRFGAPLRRVGARVRSIRGGMSGGTAASAFATLDQAAHDPAQAAQMADPFALTPGFRGPEQPDGDSALLDELTGAWTGPFVMAAINAKNVHRTNALRGHPWGRDFEYDERVVTGTGLAGAAIAHALAQGARMQAALFGVAPLRELIGRALLPRPGTGPTRRQREAGSFRIELVGLTANGRRLGSEVRGDRDPGYGSTSRMIAESAICLLRDVPRTATPGGVWTPGAAMGLALVRRLQANAGVSFEIVD